MWSITEREIFVDLQTFFTFDTDNGILDKLHRPFTITVSSLLL